MDNKETPVAFHSEALDSVPNPSTRSGWGRRARGVLKKGVSVVGKKLNQVVEHAVNKAHHPDNTFDYELYPDNPGHPEAKRHIDQIAAMTFPQTAHDEETPAPLTPKRPQEAPGAPVKWDPFDQKREFIERVRAASEAAYHASANGEDVKPVNSVPEIQIPAKTQAQVQQEEEVAEWKAKLAAGKIDKNGSEIFQPTREEMIAENEASRAEVQEWQQREEELHSADVDRQQRLETVRAQAEEEKQQLEAEAQARKDLGDSLAERDKQEEVEQLRSESSKVVRQEAGQVDVQAERAGELEADLIKARNENAESDAEIGQWQQQEREMSRLEKERLAMVPEKRAQAEADKARLEELAERENAWLGLRIPPTREQLNEVVSNLKPAVDNPFSVGFIGGFGTRLALRAFGVGDIALEHTMSTTAGAFAGTGLALIRQIQDGNRKYQEKVAETRYNTFADRLFADAARAQNEADPADYMQQKLRELNTSADENNRKQLIKDALKAQGIDNPPDVLVNNYLSELDNSDPEKQQERIDTVKLSLMERARNSGFNLNRTINAIILSAGGAMLGSHLAGIGEQYDLQAGPLAESNGTETPDKSGSSNDSEVNTPPVPNPPDPKTAISPQGIDPNPEAVSGAPEQRSAEPFLPERDQNPVPQNPVDPSVSVDTNPEISAQPQVNAPLIDWNQTIDIKPGSSFWNSINLDSIQDWTRENYFQSKSEVIKDAIAKFSEANGKPLNIIQPGELNLNQLLTDEQRTIINQIATSDNVHDYLEGGLKDQVQDMLNQTRAARIR